MTKKFDRKLLFFHTATLHWHHYPKQESWFKLLAKRHRNHLRKLLLTITAVLTAGTLFLGGSYLFLVQLAEYGW